MKWLILVILGGKIMPLKVLKIINWLAGWLAD
jgi:hypothetical protein